MFPKIHNDNCRPMLKRRFIGDTIKFKLKVGDITKTYTDLTSFDDIRVMVFTDKHKYVFVASLENGIAEIDTITNTLEFEIDQESCLMFRPGELRIRIEFYKNNEMYSVESPAIMELVPTVFMESPNGVQHNHMHRKMMEVV